MIQKGFFNIIVAMFLFVTIFEVPSLASAEEPNVIDWVNGEEEIDKQKNPEQEKREIELNTEEEKSPLLLVGQLILYTLFILVLIYALIKFLALRQKKMQPNQAVRMLGGTPLGNNKSLQLVKVGGKIYLIGVADQITLIKEFSSAEDISDIESNIEQQSFLFSSSVFNRSKKAETTASKLTPKEGFEQLFIKSLDRQKVKQHQLEHELLEEDEGEDKPS